MRALADIVRGWWAVLVDDRKWEGVLYNSGNRDEESQYWKFRFLVFDLRNSSGV